MASDMFSSDDANDLLKYKYIHFFGDSNIRSIYKDLLWLLEDGRLIPEAKLKLKNEESHANDYRVSNGYSHNGVEYEERREYFGSGTVKFDFITRLFRHNFISTIQNSYDAPDVIIIHSCVWDLTRWGTNGVQQYKTHLEDTFTYLQSNLPRTRVIWITAMPPSFKSRGGFLTKDIEFMRNMLPWHIVHANNHAYNVARSFSIDVLDLHYHFRFLMNYHVQDGIHWERLVVRFATNLILSHIALIWKRRLPNNVQLNKPSLLEHNLIINKNIPSLLEHDLIINKNIPSLLDHDLIINKNIPSLLEHDLIINKNIPSLLEHDLIINKNIPPVNKNVLQNITNTVEQRAPKKTGPIRNRRFRKRKNEYHFYNSRSCNVIVNYYNRNRSW